MRWARSSEGRAAGRRGAREGKDGRKHGPREARAGLPGWCVRRGSPSPPDLAAGGGADGPRADGPRAASLTGVGRGTGTAAGNGLERRLPSQRDPEAGIPLAEGGRATLAREGGRGPFGKSGGVRQSCRGAGPAEPRSGRWSSSRAAARRSDIDVWSGHGEADAAAHG